MSVSIRCPSEFMTVVILEHCTPDNQLLDVVKPTTLTPLSLQILCKLSFQIVGLKISSLLALALKTHSSSSGSS
jgi:hypothetical protein